MQVLNSLQKNGIPAFFYPYAIPQSDIQKLNPHTSKSGGETWLVKRKTTSAKLIFKTVQDLRSFPAMISSTLSVNFFFLSPCVGFSLNEPRGLFFKYYEGVRPLREVLKDTTISSTHKTLIAALVCYAMTYLESGCLLHGALNSDNVLVTRDFVPIVTDYGLARRYTNFDRETDHDDMGWVPPEFLFGASAYYSADVYSFGALLFEMFEGKRPYSNLSNGEILAMMRENRAELKFVRTPKPAQGIILQCMSLNPNLRPNFSELYTMFRKPDLWFAGTNEENVKSVLSQFTLEMVFKEGETAGSTPSGEANLDALAILGSPEHPQFEEFVQFLTVTVTPEQTKRFCNAVTNHVMKGQADAALVQFVLAAVDAICRRGRDFVKAVVDSGFLSVVHITTDKQADILLDIMLPVFEANSALFGRKVYKAAAMLMLYHPDALLNLFSVFFSEADYEDPEIENHILMFFHMAAVFVGCVCDLKCLKIVLLLRARYPRVREAVDALLAQFSQSKNRETAELASRSLSLSGVVSDASPVKLIAGIQNPTTVDDVIAYLLSVEEIPVIPEAIPYIVEKATASSDRRAWALLMKYAMTSRDHAETMLTDCSWMERDLPTPLDTFRLALAVFQYEPLRQFSLKRRETYDMFTRVCAMKRRDLLQIVVEIMKSHMHSSIVKVASESGFLTSFLKIALESERDEPKIAGLVLAESIARITYTEELTIAVRMCIRILKEGGQNHPLLGNVVDNALSIMSQHKQCMDIMKQNGMVEYYTRLASVKNSQAVEFFLSNAQKGT